jgi:hypothetical protein
VKGIVEYNDVFTKQEYQKVSYKRKNAEYPTNKERHNSSLAMTKMLHCYSNTPLKYSSPDALMPLPMGPSFRKNWARPPNDGPEIFDNRPFPCLSHCYNLLPGAFELHNLGSSEILI